MSEFGRDKEVMGIGLGQNFDMRPYSLVTEMKRLLKPISDEGTSMDSGTMDGEADMYITVGGVEFSVIVKVARKA